MSPVGADHFGELHQGTQDGRRIQGKFFRQFRKSLVIGFSQISINGNPRLCINLKQTGNAKPVTINTDLAKAYYKALAELSKELSLDPSAILSTLVKLPEVITPTGDTLTEEEWTQFKKVVLMAIDDLNVHRLNEGRVLEDDLILRINNISIQQEEILKLQPLRQQKIRDGLEKLLEEHVGKDHYDSNRLEQEMIYYLEKIDISEEQVRLKNHCAYFKEVLAEPEDSKGKKLSFILQEIGREINTTGSKAYDVTIQRCCCTDEG